MFGTARKRARGAVADGNDGDLVGRAPRMGAARRIAGLVCGRWTKWVVVVLWFAVVSVAGPLAGKLNSAQKNDASEWLPKNAESTRVLELAKRFTPGDVFPALVVYERAGGGVTPADRAKVAADAQRFAGVGDISGKVQGPVPASDGRALQVLVPLRIATRATAGSSWVQGSTSCARSRGPTPPPTWGCT
jgi:hypothetical protein